MSLSFNFCWAPLIATFYIVRKRALSDCHDHYFELIEVKDAVVIHVTVQHVLQKLLFL